MKLVEVPAKVLPWTQAAAAWLVLSCCAAVSAQEAITLRESFRSGYEYHVSTRVELSGTLTLPAEKEKSVKPLPVLGTSAIEYDERVLNVAAAGAVDKTMRIYRRVDFQRQVGGRPQQSTVRPEVRRLVLLRLNQVEVPFSPDGPLTWGEIDLVRTDVFTPALAGLLPSGSVRPGARWPAEAGAVQELTDLERIEEGKIECRLEEITSLNQRRLARIAFAGTVAGVNEDGPNRQQLDGYCLFDLESQHLSYLYLKGTHLLLDKDGKEQGRIEGRFVLTRQVNTRSPDLTEQALRGLELTPNDQNTLLLYENPDFGVRLLHPRRWKVAEVRGRQVTLDAAPGNGLLLTLEPRDRVPSSVQFLAETRTYLQQQQAKNLREEPPQRRQEPPRELEHFAIEAEIGGQRALLDYYIARQAQGGVTVAARLRPDDAAARKEVEGIARSLVILSAPKDK
jgi:hypothetical protein